ncbi:hypothetical protein ACFOEK_11880 [Litoribrevibacter euphylliae]|uniref:Uncharacterized protein n=1 Tax=Litoribrevibacter euphylliae TaxID=1834034 RepID=A0ABV7HCV2_9GAMM
MESSLKKASDFRKLLELISAMNRVYELRERHAESDLIPETQSIAKQTSSLH